MMMEPAADAPITPKQAIFHSADLLSSRTTTTTISVRGTIAFLDHELGRMDIAKDGAKLIVRLRLSQQQDLQVLKQLKEGQRVTVSGTLKKEQRRTFLEATEVSIDHSPP
jgi:hypothetical protein